MRRKKNDMANSNVNVMAGAVPPMDAGQVLAKEAMPDPREQARELAKLEALYVSLSGVYFDGAWEFRAKLGAAITERRLGR